MNGMGAAGAAAGLVGVLVMGLVVGIGATGDAEPDNGGCVVTAPGEGGPGGAQSGPQEQAELSAEQMAIARTIVGVGKGMGIQERGTAIALGTAMQESTLDPNVPSPGGRSVGLFQQQGEFYAHVNRTDPVDTSRAFYEMLLQRVPEYADPAAVGFADAAQIVQASGAGAHWYARWEHWSTTLAAQLYSGTPAEGGPAAEAVHCAPGGGSGPVEVALNGTTVEVPSEGLALRFPNDKAARAAAAALSYLDTPYSWGGGSPDGPTKGVRDGGVADAHGDYQKVGFDCAGLTQYAYAQAGIDLTRPARTQLSNATNVQPWNQALPGDLLFWGGHHVAMYLGEHAGQPLMVEAPQSGDVVKISPVRTGGDFRNQVARPA